MKNIQLFLPVSLLCLVLANWGLAQSSFWFGPGKVIGPGGVLGGSNTTINVTNNNCQTTTTSTNTTACAPNATSGIDPVVGDTLIVKLTITSTSISATVTDDATPPNTYTNATGSPTPSVSGSTGWIFVAPVTHTKTGLTVTATEGGAGTHGKNIDVVDVIGIASSSYQDQSMTMQTAGSGTTCTAPAISTAVANDLIVGFLFNSNGSATAAASTGYALFANQSTVPAHRAVYQIVSSTGSYSPGFTALTSGASACGAIAVHG